MTDEMTMTDRQQEIVKAMKEAASLLRKADKLLAEETGHPDDHLLTNSGYPLSYWVERTSGEIEDGFLADG